MLGYSRCTQSRASRAKRSTMGTSAGSGCDAPAGPARTPSSTTPAPRTRRDRPRRRRPPEHAIIRDMPHRVPDQPPPRTSNRGSPPGRCRSAAGTARRAGLVTIMTSPADRPVRAPADGHAGLSCPRRPSTSRARAPAEHRWSGSGPSGSSAPAPVRPRNTVETIRGPGRVRPVRRRNTGVRRGRARPGWARARAPADHRVLVSPQETSPPLPAPAPVRPRNTVEHAASVRPSRPAPVRPADRRAPGRRILRACRRCVTPSPPEASALP